MVNMKKILLNKYKLLKTRKGEYDLIVSLFVIMALTIFMFMYINFMADLGIKTDLDQVARKYILYLETVDFSASGTSKDQVKADIKTDLEKIKGVECTNITIDSNGYGRTLTLHIECNAKVTKIANENNKLDILHGLMTRNREQKFVINKQSTSKY